MYVSALWEEVGVQREPRNARGEQTQHRKAPGWDGAHNLLAVKWRPSPCHLLMFTSPLSSLARGAFWWPSNKLNSKVLAVGLRMSAPQQEVVEEEMPLWWEAARSPQTLPACYTSFKARLPPHCSRLLQSLRTLSLRAPCDVSDREKCFDAAVQEEEEKIKEEIMFFFLILCLFVLQM